MRSPRQKEQLERIRPLSGILSMQRRTPEERSEFARSGGAARARKLTQRERSESARKAALARWGKLKKRKTVKAPRKSRKGVDIKA